MSNTRNVFRSGGSLSVTIPDFIAKQLNLSVGTPLEIDLIDRKDGTQPMIRMQRTLQEPKVTTLDQVSPQNTKKAS